MLNDAKVDKVSDKGLSTNDYTTAEKSKLAGIAAGANNYTHPATHPASMITGLPSSLPANGGTADKVANKLTAGSKSFDGSAAVTLTAADLGALTSIPATYVTETEYATTSKGGVVKSSALADKVKVETDGTMSLNTVNASKITGTLAIAKGGTGVTTLDELKSLVGGSKFEIISRRGTDTRHPYNIVFSITPRVWGVLFAEAVVDNYSDSTDPSSFVWIPNYDSRTTLTSRSGGIAHMTWVNNNTMQISMHSADNFSMADSSNYLFHFYAIE